MRVLIFTDTPPEMVRVEVKIIFGVNAHGPHAKGHSAESPQLLWNPHHILGIAMWIESQPVADGADPKLTKSDGIFVERMGWRDPTIGAHSFAGKDFESLFQIGSLLFQGNTGKLAVRLQPNDAGILADVSMLISVQTDRPSARLPSSHSLPKAFVRFAFVKVGILIVGDHR